MATSERILTPLPGAPSTENVAHISWPSPDGRSIWRQVVADCVTVFLVAATAETLLERSGASSIPHLLSTCCAEALLVSAFLAFAGAYPRHYTPLAIADTEGLVRGVCCALMLVLIYSVNNRTIPSRSLLLATIAIALLLIVQRELLYALTGQKRPLSACPGDKSTAGIHHVVVPHEARRDSSGPTSRSFDQPCFVSPSGFLLKRCIDLAGALFLLLLFLPLFAAIAVLIKVDSRGPVFIRQRRIGTGGTPFYIWKFRSMYEYVARYERSPASDTDPRLTNLGRALRRLSLDETPQLLNVVRGEMSLVGPRPEMPFLAEQYDQRERLRLNAIPGITGLWQISPARAMPIHHNLYLDLYYIQHRNLFLDIAIILRTVTAVFRGIGAI